MQHRARNHVAGASRLRSLAPLALLTLLTSAAMLFAPACARDDDGGGAAKAPEAEAAGSPEADVIPAPMREFRAAWVATVANIDWPSKPGLPPEQQRAEAARILDRLVELGMNAVIFQVRPHADALYASELEPWSAYLSGEQGRAPEPFYDPLAFWVEAAHTRGLALHAWFNPYRVCHPAQPGPLHESSIAKTKPELVVRLGTKGYRWMDPAREEVQRHSIDVVLDVVRRYDIDGVHFDDYFYPYRSYNDGADFPDALHYAEYREDCDKRGESALGLHDWRRAAVDRFVETLAREIRATKPHVMFGISPFGIWRPGHPRGIEGLDQYDVLFADAKRWWNEGWLDYLMPQLYWPIAQAPQSFPLLLAWWRDENRSGKHLWPGLSMRKPTTEAGANEVASQIFVARGMLGEDNGVCLFSMKSLLRPDARVAPRLAKTAFREPALQPRSPWISDAAPATPEAELAADPDGTLLTWEATPDARVYVVYEELEGRWKHRILGPDRRRVVLDSKATRCAVTAVDRLGNESARALVGVPARTPAKSDK